LDLANVRPYWRDAHSPAIARRPGIYEYRHYPLDPIRGDLVPAIAGIDTVGVTNEQLMWLSDVRYADEAGMKTFSESPGPLERKQILADIEMIVDKSTTYKVIGENGRTLVDRTGVGAPQGPVSAPTFEIFFRQRGDEPSFRAVVRELAEDWARRSSVLRVRINLFEVPDMEAERKAGYPVKTHPVEMQYQAWIDLIVDSERALTELLVGAPRRWADHISAIHAYQAPAVYTFNYRGKPTLAGLRGYPAVAAIRSLGAEHQRDPALLEWMYGEIARGGASA
jgi:hypothetical protein